MNPAELYAAYLTVWSKDFSGNPAAMEYAASIFSAMGAAADQGLFVLGQDNKYYPAGQQPTHYDAVPVPGSPGSVNYVPTPPPAAGSTGGSNVTPPTGTTGGGYQAAPGLQITPTMLLLGLGVLYLFSRK